MTLRARSFYVLWWRTAFPKAWAILNHMSLVIGLVALVWVGSDASAQGLAQRLSWQAPLGVFLVTLVWRLLVAPLEIYTAQCHELAALRSAHTKTRACQDLADRLTERYHFAVHHILHELPVKVEELGAWKVRVHVWTQEVLALMREHHCTLQDLNHVETITPFDLQLHSSDPNDVALHMFRVRLQRVADISTKYAQKAEERNPLGDDPASMVTRG